MATSCLALLMLVRCYAHDGTVTSLRSFSIMSVSLSLAVRRSFGGQTFYFSTFS